MDSSRVLIVDDEEHVRRAIRIVFESEGFTVHEASSGEVALREWADFAPQVVVTDNRMQGISGLDVALHMRERVTIPVVVCSGHVDDELRDAAVRLGVHVVEKPNIDALVSTVRKALAGRLSQ